MNNKTLEGQAKEFVENNKFRIDFPADYMSFIFGFRAKQKETDKIILDTLNKYRSALYNQQKVKLTKVVNQDKIELLKAQVNVLLELQNKLK